MTENWQKTFGLTFTNSSLCYLPTFSPSIETIYSVHKHIWTLAFSKKYYFIYFWLYSGLCCFSQSFSSCSEWRLLFIAVHGLLTAVEKHCGLCPRGFSCYRAHTLGARISVAEDMGSVVLAHRLSCSGPCGIFPDQGLNPCPLHWEADSCPLDHRGSHKLLLKVKYSVCQKGVLNRLCSDLALWLDWNDTS